MTAGCFQKGSVRETLACRLCAKKQRKLLLALLCARHTCFQDATSYTILSPVIERSAFAEAIIWRLCSFAPLIILRMKNLQPSQPSFVSSIFIELFKVLRDQKLTPIGLKHFAHH
jgi:hypothetical protein